MPQAQEPQEPQEEGEQWYRIWCCECSDRAVVRMAEVVLADHAWSSGDDGGMVSLVRGEEDRYGTRGELEFFRRRGRSHLDGVQSAATDAELDRLPVPTFSERRASGWVCRDCLTYCEECGEATDRTDLSPVIVSNGSTAPWCRDCRDLRSGHCGDCGEPVDSAALHGEYDACPQCVRARLRHMAGDAPSVILPYHSDFRRSRSRLIDSEWTRATGWHIGVELEVERVARSRSRDELAGLLQAAANREGRRLWAEMDGSLGDGFELISEPMGLDAHRGMWPVVLASDAVRSLRSHSTSTCGLHVHISRRGITRHQLARANRLLGMQEAAVFFRAVARRWESSYGCAKRSGFSGEREVAMLSTPSGRYEALNLTGSRTVEFRLWRGSLLPQAVLASIEASVAILRYARAATMSEVSVAGFLRHLHRPDHAAETVHVRPYIRRRLHAAAAVASSREEAAALGAWLALLPPAPARTTPPVSAPSASADEQ